MVNNLIKMNRSLTRGILVLIFFTTAAHLSSAQNSNNEGEPKIRIKIQKDINGKKETIEKSYGSIEDMKLDPDLKDGKFNIWFGDGLDGDISLFLKEGILGDDKFDALFDDFDFGQGHNLHSFKNGITLKSNSGRITIEKDGETLSLRRDENGDIFIIEDGEEIHLDDYDNDAKLQHFDYDNREDLKQNLGKSGTFIFRSNPSEHFEEMEKRLREMLDGLDRGNFDLDNDEDVDVLKLDRNDGDNGVKIIVRVFNKIRVEEIGKEEELSEDLHLDDKEPLWLDRLSFYPNPSEGRFTVSFEADAAPLSLKIVDITGRTVYEEDLGQFSGYYNQEIDLSGQDRGIYILQVTQGNKVNSKKLILE